MRQPRREHSPSSSATKFYQPYSKLDLTRYETMFRLPTHLEDFIPPPSHQSPVTPPWCGSLVLPMSSPSPRGSHQELQCTAAVTSGDK